MRAIAVLSLAILLSSARSAWAVDTIYLRDGRILRCQITSQAPATLTYERWGYTYTLEKQAVEWRSPPPAVLAGLAGLALPGGGQLVSGDFGAFQQSLGATILMGGLSYLASYYLFTGRDAATSVLAGVSLGLLPWLTAAWQATWTAWQEGAHPPLHIERDETSYHPEVGELVAP